MTNDFDFDTRTTLHMPDHLFPHQNIGMVQFSEFLKVQFSSVCLEQVPSQYSAFGTGSSSLLGQDHEYLEHRSMVDAQDVTMQLQNRNNLMSPTKVATIVHTMRTYACSCYMQQGCMVVTFWQMQKSRHSLLALIVQQLYGMQLLPVLHLECFSCLYGQAIVMAVPLAIY